MVHSPPKINQPKEIFTDEIRCAACGGKCCQIYRPMSKGGTFPDGDDFETWCRDFHPGRDAYGIEPLFHPIEVYHGNNPHLREALTAMGINPECCEYVGYNGCRLSREKRPEQCLSFRCESWLAEEISGS